MRFLRRLILGSGLFFGLSTAGLAACLPTPAAYELPAGRLDAALQQFAHTSGCFVEVDLAQVGERQVAALSGRYTPGNALIRLVRGSGLEVHLNDGHYVVNQADRQALERRIDRVKTAIDNAHDNDALSGERADALRAQLDDISTSGASFIDRQGFLSAAEKASFERVFAFMRGELGAVRDADTGSLDTPQ